MSIKVKCPNCDGVNEIADSIIEAQSAARCRECKAVFNPSRLVPAPALSELAAHVEEIRAAERTSRKPERKQQATLDEILDCLREMREEHPSDGTFLQFWRIIGRAVSAVAWLVCGIVILITILAHFADLHRAESAPQQAAVAAMSCFVVIAAYTFTRAFDKFLRG